jgi:hypothetical protein
MLTSLTAFGIHQKMWVIDRLYKKLEIEDELINAHGLFSHPAFAELRQRLIQIIEKRELQREKLLTYILATFPDVSRSEYLRNR